VILSYIIAGIFACSVGLYFIQRGDSVLGFVLIAVGVSFFNTATILSKIAPRGLDERREQ
jgi:hypothetical protein